MKSPGFLWKKEGENSKTSFWLFMVMVPVLIILWVVAIRLALIPDEYFTQALVSGGGFTGIVTLIITRLYFKRRENGVHTTGEEDEKDEKDEKEELEPERQ